MQRVADIIKRLDSFFLEAIQMQNHKEKTKMLKILSSQMEKIPNSQLIRCDNNLDVTR